MLLRKIVTNNLIISFMCGLHKVLAKFIEENWKYWENVIIFTILPHGIHKKAFTTTFWKATDFVMQNTLEKFIWLKTFKFILCRLNIAKFWPNILFYHNILLIKYSILHFLLEIVPWKNISAYFRIMTKYSVL